MTNITTLSGCINILSEIFLKFCPPVPIPYADLTREQKCQQKQNTSYQYLLVQS